MPASIRKAKSQTVMHDETRFPPEAFSPQDDVTPEAVEILRKKAAKVIEASKWELVDGFGLSNGY